MGQSRFRDADEMTGKRFYIDWHRKLHANGLVGMSWPKEYGGKGATPVQQAILNEELARCSGSRTAGWNRAGAGRPHDYRSWRRVAEKTLPAQDSVGRGEMVPTVLGAQRRLGPGLAEHPRRTQRGSIPRQRAKNLDLRARARRTLESCWRAATPTPPSTRVSAT